MSDAEAEIQATAAISPVSPTPSHAAASQAVPVLQDAAEAMTAEAAAEEPTVDTANISASEHGDVVDDDSFNEAYEAEENTVAEDATADNTNPDEEVDDYAKTFDSPIGSHEGDAMTDDVHSPEPLTVLGDIKQASAVTSGTATPTVQSSTSQLPPQTQAASTAQTNAQPAEAPAPVSATQQPAQDTNQDENLDIGQLVADLTAQSSEPSADNNPTTFHESSVQGSAAIPSSASSSSLPPRPPAPQLATQTYPAQHHLPPAPGTSNSPTFPNGGSPQAPLSASGTSPSHTPTQRHAPRFPSNSAPSSDYQRQWDQFMVDERQYMSEAKWDRFPEGSRIFIGNLSSDKVSKRDVFELFHQYGRLAQISLKPAYGFVQYHTVEEGSRAIENLQDFEVQGRRIHLEISKLQDKTKKDRNDSDKGRGGKRGERGERGERGDRGRDDYRSSRNQSPRRNNRGRDDGYGRDRGFNDSRRNRSRSPGYGGRHDKDSYRRRSPSPYGRSRNDDEMDLPRRYGPDVPDLQFILHQEVDRNFVSWVEQAFNSKGLKTAVMFLHPRFPKEKVIQRQAVEGVHAVVELNFRAQNSAKIPLQVFDRSAGPGNVRFDKYEDLDPATAAEVTLRAKAATVAAQYHHQQPPAPAAQYGYVQPGYGQPAPPAYVQQPPAPVYPAPNAAPAPNVAELASMMSKMDSASLHQLLSVVQGTPGNQPPAFPGQSNGQPDLNAILGALGTAPPQGPPQQGGYGRPANGGGAPPPQGGADAAQVQNIMAQLARFR